MFGDNEELTDTMIAACKKEKKWRVCPECPTVESEFEFWVRVETLVHDDTTVGERSEIKASADVDAATAKNLVQDGGVFARGNAPTVPGLTDCGASTAAAKAGRGGKPAGKPGDPPLDKKCKAEICVPGMANPLQEAQEFTASMLADLGTIKSLPPQLRSIGGQSELAGDLDECAKSLESNYDKLMKLINGEIDEPSTYMEAMEDTVRAVKASRKKIKAAKSVIAALGPARQKKKKKTGEEA